MKRCADGRRSLPGMFPTRANKINIRAKILPETPKPHLQLQLTENKEQNLKTKMPKAKPQTISKTNTQEQLIKSGLSKWKNKYSKQTVVSRCLSPEAPRTPEKIAESPNSSLNAPLVFGLDDSPGVLVIDTSYDSMESEKVTPTKSTVILSNVSSKSVYEHSPEKVEVIEINPITRNQTSAGFGWGFDDTELPRYTVKSSAFHKSKSESNLKEKKPGFRKPKSKTSEKVRKLTRIETNKSNVADTSKCNLGVERLQGTHGKISTNSQEQRCLKRMDTSFENNGDEYAVQHALSSIQQSSLDQDVLESIINLIPDSPSLEKHSFVSDSDSAMHESGESLLTSEHVSKHKHVPFVSTEQFPHSDRSTTQTNEPKLPLNKHQPRSRSSVFDRLGSSIVSSGTNVCSRKDVQNAIDSQDVQQIPDSVDLPEETTEGIQEETISHDDNGNVLKLTDSKIVTKQTTSKNDSKKTKSPNAPRKTNSLRNEKEKDSKKGPKTKLKGKISSKEAASTHCNHETKGSTPVKDRRTDDVPSAIPKRSEKTESPPKKKLQKSQPKHVSPDMPKVDQLPVKTSVQRPVKLMQEKVQPINIPPASHHKVTSITELSMTLEDEIDGGNIQSSARTDDISTKDRCQLDKDTTIKVPVSLPQDVFSMSSACCDSGVEANRQNEPSISNNSNTPSKKLSSCKTWDVPKKMITPSKSSTSHPKLSSDEKNPSQVKDSKSVSSPKTLPNDIHKQLLKKASLFSNASVTYGFNNVGQSDNQKPADFNPRNIQPDIPKNTPKFSPKADPSLSKKKLCFSPKTLPTDTEKKLPKKASLFSDSIVTFGVDSDQSDNSVTSFTPRKRSLKKLRFPLNETTTPPVLQSSSSEKKRIVNLPTTPPNNTSQNLTKKVSMFSGPFVGFGINSNEQRDSTVNRETHKKTLLDNSPNSVNKSKKQTVIQCPKSPVRQSSNIKRRPVNKNISSPLCMKASVQSPSQPISTPSKTVTSSPDSFVSVDASGQIIVTVQNDCPESPIPNDTVMEKNSPSNCRNKSPKVPRCQDSPAGNESFETELEMITRDEEEFLKVSENVPRVAKAVPATFPTETDEQIHKDSRKRHKCSSEDKTMTLSGMVSDEDQQTSVESNCAKNQTSPKQDMQKPAFKKKKMSPKEEKDMKDLQVQIEVKRSQFKIGCQNPETVSEVNVPETDENNILDSITEREDGSSKMLDEVSLNQNKQDVSPEQTTAKTVQTPDYSISPETHNTHLEDEQLQDSSLESPPSISNTQTSKTMMLTLSQRLSLPSDPAKSPAHMDCSDSEEEEVHQGDNITDFESATTPTFPSHFDSLSTSLNFSSDFSHIPVENLEPTLCLGERTPLKGRPLGHVFKKRGRPRKVKTAEIPYFNDIKKKRKNSENSNQVDCAESSENESLSFKCPDEIATPDQSVQKHSHEMLVQISVHREFDSDQQTLHDLITENRNNNCLDEKDEPDQPKSAEISSHQEPDQYGGQRSEMSGPTTFAATSSQGEKLEQMERIECEQAQRNEGAYPNDEAKKTQTSESTSTNDETYQTCQTTTEEVENTQRSECTTTYVDTCTKSVSPTIARKTEKLMCDKSENLSKNAVFNKSHKSETKLSSTNCSVSETAELVSMTISPNESQEYSEDQSHCSQKETGSYSSPLKISESELDEEQSWLPTNKHDTQVSTKDCIVNEELPIVEESPVKTETDEDYVISSRESDVDYLITSRDNQKEFGQKISKLKLSSKQPKQNQNNESSQDEGKDVHVTIPNTNLKNISERLIYHVNLNETVKPDDVSCTKNFVNSSHETLGSCKELEDILQLDSTDEMEASTDEGQPATLAEETMSITDFDPEELKQLERETITQLLSNIQSDYVKKKQLMFKSKSDQCELLQDLIVSESQEDLENSSGTSANAEDLYEDHSSSEFIKDHWPKTIGPVQDVVNEKPELDPKIILFNLSLKKNMKIGKFSLYKSGVDGSTYHVHTRQRQTVVTNHIKCPDTSDNTDFGFAISRPVSKKNMKTKHKRETVPFKSHIPLSKPVAPKVKKVLENASSHLPESKLALSILKKKAEQENKKPFQNEILPFEEMLQMSKSSNLPQKRSPKKSFFGGLSTDSITFGLNESAPKPSDSELTETANSSKKKQSVMFSPNLENPLKRALSSSQSSSVTKSILKTSPSYYDSRKTGTRSEDRKDCFFDSDDGHESSTTAVPLSDTDAYSETDMQSCDEEEGEDDEKEASVSSEKHNSVEMIDADRSFEVSDSGLEEKELSSDVDKDEDEHKDTSDKGSEKSTSEDEEDSPDDDSDEDEDDEKDDGCKEDSDAESVLSLFADADDEFLLDEPDEDVTEDKTRSKKCASMDIPLETFDSEITTATPVHINKLAPVLSTTVVSEVKQQATEDDCDSDNMDIVSTDSTESCSKNVLTKLRQALRYPEGFCYNFLNGKVCNQPCRYIHDQPQLHHYKKKAEEQFSEQISTGNYDMFYKLFMSIADCFDEGFPCIIFEVAVGHASEINASDEEFIFLLNYVKKYTIYSGNEHKIAVELIKLIEVTENVEVKTMCVDIIWLLFWSLKANYLEPHISCLLKIMQQHLAFPDKLHEVVTYCLTNMQPVPSGILQKALPHDPQLVEMILEIRTLRALGVEFIRDCLMPMCTTVTDQTKKRLVDAMTPVEVPVATLPPAPPSQIDDENLNSEEMKSFKHRIQAFSLERTLMSSIVNVYLELCQRPAAWNTHLLQDYVNALYDVNCPANTATLYTQFITEVEQQFKRDRQVDMHLEVDKLTLAQIGFHIIIKLHDNYVPIRAIFSSIVITDLPFQHLEPIDHRSFIWVLIDMAIRTEGSVPLAVLVVSRLHGLGVQEDLMMWGHLLLQLVNKVMQYHLYDACDVLTFALKHAQFPDMHECSLMCNVLFERAMFKGHIDAAVAVYRVCGKLLRPELLERLLYECCQSNMVDVATYIFKELYNLPEYHPSLTKPYKIELLPRFSYPLCRMVIEMFLRELYVLISDEIIQHGYHPADENLALTVTFGNGHSANHSLRRILNELGLEWQLNQTGCKVEVKSLKSYLKRLDEKSKNIGMFLSMGRGRTGIRSRGKVRAHPYRGR